MCLSVGQWFRLETSKGGTEKKRGEQKTRTWVTEKRTGGARNAEGRTEKQTGGGTEKCTFYKVGHMGRDTSHYGYYNKIGAVSVGISWVWLFILINKTKYLSTPNLPSVM